ncbi:unnamed protein product [Rhodiola kirilowii]
MNNPDLKLTNPDLKLMQSQIRVPDASQSLLCHFTIWFHQETPRDRKSAATFVVANAIMFAAPLEALAETCEPNYVGLSMPVLLAVALVGATVGGLVARQRKRELQRVNEQLRQINTALRRQAKIESYAPKLSSAVQRNQVVRKQNGHGHGHTHGHGHLTSSAVIVH